ncbi:STAS domain-containing protein [Kitasatospora paracochleata]|uniref:Anti-sigma factor antagonist n=1 Tax=Kitasatospora paracochleata TaxID=58354 RepID=A0ABT1J2B6_9ACTN|nr:STAS domain-containing protein [Kitasatospora paracochleata]MCP2311547.1 anti-anti-sigma factor [Kitasatospora paracochleata]
MGTRHPVPTHSRHGNAPALRVTTPGTDGALIVRLAGEIDVTQCRTLELHLVKAFSSRPEQLVVDLSHVTFCDTAGLNSLLRVHRAARAADSRLVLARPSQPVRSLLEITGMCQVFTVSPVLRTAVSTETAAPGELGVSP